MQNVCLLFLTWQKQQIHTCSIASDLCSALITLFTLGTVAIYRASNKTDSSG